MVRKAGIRAAGIGLAGLLNTVAAPAGAQTVTDGAPVAAPPVAAPPGASPEAPPVAAAPAAEMPGDIVVTAQRRAQRLEEVPLSITAVSGDTLQKSGVVRFQDLGNVAPAVQISRGGAFTQPAIRGVSTLTTGPGYENNVAVYIDGFFQPDTVAINGDFANIADVQVLKGPQGTLYGRNATAGAILVTTLAPSRTLTGSAQLSYGRFDDKRAQAYLSGPLGEKFAYSVSGYYRRSDGYIRDIAGFDSAPVKNDTIRTKLQFDPSSGIKLTAAYNYLRVLDARGLVYTEYANTPSLVPGTTIPYPQPPERATERNTSSLNRRPDADARMHQATLTAVIDTDLGTLTSYTGYFWKALDLRFDFDGSKLGISETIQPSKQRTFQQSVDFAIDRFKSVDLIIGASYLYDKYNYSNRAIAFNTFSRTTYVQQISKAMALYADATFHLTDSLFLTAGARYAVEDKDASYFDRPGNVPAQLAPSADKSAGFSAVTPRAVLRYELAPRTNVYASFSQGFRTGTFPVTSFPDPSLFQPIRPERITSYEVGFKTAGAKLRFDAAAYYYDYKNLQVGLTIPNPFVAAAVVQQVINAKRAEIYGTEASASWTPSRDVTVRAGAAYTHARYKDFANATANGLNAALQRNITAQPQDWSGKQMARAPGFTGNLGANYRIALAGGALDLSGNFAYTSSFVVSNPSLFGPLAGPELAGRQRYRQKAYGLLGGQVGWTDPSGRYTLSVYGENITNTRYLVVSSGGLFGDYRVYGEPTTYGVRAGVKF